MAVARDDVLAAYADGVDAIERYAPRFDAAQWASAACGEWSAAQVAAHVEHVAGWYDQWLDRAERGDARPAFSIDELPHRNAEALAASGAAGPMARVERFAASARAYAGRVRDAWDTPFGYPRGTVTAGQHAALAAVEWHVHAWDLARVLGVAHAPARPAVLAEAAAATWLASQGRGPVARATAVVGPVLARHQRDPWRALLHRMGRV
jgi:mycothiol maleylpyruvate isomerase-like protein